MTKRRQRLYSFCRSIFRSYWSRPPQIRTNRTDHWSKLKSKSYYLSQTPTGNYICYCKPQQYDSHGQKYTRMPFEVPLVSHYNNFYSHHSGQHQATDWARTRGNGKGTSRNTLALVGSPELSQQLSELGSPQLPTAQQWLGIGQSKLKRVPSASSQRAKQGFKYWPQENLSSNSKVTVGSRGTFLGIGVPRL